MTGCFDDAHGASLRVAQVLGERVRQEWVEELEHWLVCIQVRFFGGFGVCFWEPPLKTRTSMPRTEACGLFAETELRHVFVVAILFA